MKPPLTIGMAAHRDFHGVFFTINALRMYHDVRDCELIVVDNAPDTEEGQHTKNAVLNCANGWGSVRYIAAPEVAGTSAPRDRVFREAAGEAVACMDCHVLLVPGAIARLKQYYRDNPETRDILSGPLLMDNHTPGLPTTAIATHFTPRWRAEMEGTWGLGWRCKCGNIVDVIDQPEGKTTVYRPLMSEGEWKTEYRCNCGAVAPACDWPNHEAFLVANGWNPAGAMPNDPPFEIPGQGLGFFSCRKDAWLGFNPAFRGFGGEELYIHRKFRQAGAKALCLPWLGWHHRFAPAQWTTYNRSVYSKARNYVIGHQETGLDLAPVEKEFVSSGRIPADQWKHLLADPIANENPPACKTGCGSGGQNLAISEAELPAKDRERFTALGAQHERVAILGKRDWWKTVMAAGRKQGLEQVQFFPANGTVPAIEECDLLVIHSTHHADFLIRELEGMAPKTTSRILLRSTHAYGLQAETNGGGPGLLVGLSKWLRENPEWSVIEHSVENWGYTVLSRVAEDKKPLPSLAKRAWNFAQHLKDHVADGLNRAPADVVESRLAICDLCPMRNGEHCGMCGCPLGAKTGWASSYCDAGKWDLVTLPEQTQTPSETVESPT